VGIRIVDGGRPLLPEILGKIDRVGGEIADFEPIFARSASALIELFSLGVTPSEKKFN